MGWLLFYHVCYRLFYLKKFKLSNKVVEFLSFVPIVIMSALWFENLFHQRLGQLPLIDYNNLLATFPTIVSAILTRSLLVVVIVGVISLAIVQIIFLKIKKPINKIFDRFFVYYFMIVTTSDKFIRLPSILLIGLPSSRKPNPIPNKKARF